MILFSNNTGSNVFNMCRDLSLSVSLVSPFGLCANEKRASSEKDINFQKISRLDIKSKLFLLFISCITTWGLCKNKFGFLLISASIILFGLNFELHRRKKQVVPILEAKDQSSQTEMDRPTQTQSLQTEDYEFTQDDKLQEEDASACRSEFCENEKTKLTTRINELELDLSDIHKGLRETRVKSTILSGFDSSSKVINIDAVYIVSCTTKQYPARMMKSDKSIEKELLRAFDFDLLLMYMQSHLFRMTESSSLRSIIQKHCLGDDGLNPLFCEVYQKYCDNLRIKLNLYSEMVGLGSTQSLSSSDLEQRIIFGNVLLFTEQLTNTTRHLEINFRTIQSYWEEISSSK